MAFSMDSCISMNSVTQYLTQVTNVLTLVQTITSDNLNGLPSDDRLKP